MLVSLILIPSVYLLAHRARAGTRRDAVVQPA
jgi:hypothetical protein